MVTRRHRFSLPFLLTAVSLVIAPLSALAGQCADYSGPVEIIGSIDTPGHAFHVVHLGSFAYVADSEFGLQVVDVSDPEAPTLVGSEDTEGNALDVDISGNYVFISDGFPGLRIIDVSTPTDPVLVHTVDTPAEAFGVEVEGDHAYVADGSQGLQIIDISTPASATLVGSSAVIGTAYEVVVRGDLAYVASNSTLTIVDVSNPASAGIEGSVATPGFAQGVALSPNGAYAYVADANYGLQVVDVSDATNPQIVATIAMPINATDVTADANYAYATDSYAGLQVVDVSDPMNAFLIGSVATPGNAFDVARGGGLLFVTDYEAGLHILAEQCPTVTDVPGPEIAAGQLLLEAPNPFQAQAAITYGVGAGPARHVRLDVVDVRGRHVATLVDERVAPGLYSTSWDGRDRNGNAVGASVYFARLIADGENGQRVQVRKLTLTQ